MEEKRPVYFEIPKSKQIIHGVTVLRVYDEETQEEEVYMGTLREPLATDKIGLLRTALITVERSLDSAKM